MFDSINSYICFSAVQIRRSILKKKTIVCEVVNIDIYFILNKKKRSIKKGQAFEFSVIEKTLTK